MIKHFCRIKLKFFKSTVVIGKFDFLNVFLGEFHKYSFPGEVFGGVSYTGKPKINVKNQNEN